MIEKKEFHSNSLKSAIFEAAKEYNIDEEKVKYEIITDKTKYFGHKEREIYIRAWPTEENEHESLSKFSQNLIELLKIDLTFEVEVKKNFIRLNFSGGDYRLLLYQNGNLLNAVQYILNRLFSENLGKKIYCECESFRKNRERELTALAHRYARDVRKKGKAIELKELNPFERRIVHMTVNKYADLESISNGENFLKIITIKRK